MNKEYCSQCKWRDNEFCNYYNDTIKTILNEINDSRYICTGFEKQENTFGENYPTFSQLLKINNLKNDRKTLVKKLLNKDNKRITKNEIIDMSIDLWKYNKRCRRQKI